MKAVPEQSPGAVRVRPKIPAPRIKERRPMSKSNVRDAFSAYTQLSADDRKEFALLLEGFEFSAQQRSAAAEKGANTRRKSAGAGDNPDTGGDS